MSLKVITVTCFFYIGFNLYIIFFYYSLANFKYDTPYADFHEPGIGAFIIIIFMQLLMCMLIFIGLETKALDKDFLKRVFLNLFNKKKSEDQTETKVSWTKIL